jgi:hypothetical protein
VRRYEVQDVVVQREVPLEATCDGCGVSEDDESLVEVLLSVAEGGEGGAVDELHYCDACLVERSAAFVRVGSTAELVTGTPRESGDGP